MYIISRGFNDIYQDTWQVDEGAHKQRIVRDKLDAVIPKMSNIKYEKEQKFVQVKYYHLSLHKIKNTFLRLNFTFGFAFL